MNIAIVYSHKSKYAQQLATMMAKTASDSTAPETNIAPQPYEVSVTVNTVFAMTLE